MEKGCLHFFSAVPDRILFILAGNNYIHESLGKFEILPDSTLVSMIKDRVMMGKNSVSTFSRLFFIHSFLYLQVMMTCMRARKSSNFGLI